MILKINNGAFKSQTLRTINIQGTRPLKHNIKTTIFNIIANKIKNSKVLDLYAGYGTFGVEALSLQANFVHWNDVNYQCIKQIQKWVEKLKLQKNQYKITKFDASKLVKFKNWPYLYDIIFFDPPFALEQAQINLQLLLVSKLIHQNSLIIFRTSSKIQLDAIFNVHVYKKKKIGSNVIYFLTKATN